MLISYEKIRDLLELSYDLGLVSCNDLRDQLITELIYKEKIIKEQKLKIYSPTELLSMPIGSTFIHPTLGKGRIANRGSGMCMEFENCDHYLNKAGFPWNVPMLRILFS